MAGVFFQIPITSASAGVRSAVAASAWHPELPLLAIGYASGLVAAFTDEGDRLEQGGAPATVSKGISPSALAWHPQTRHLAVGWRDGSVSLWSESDWQSRDVGQVHEQPIALLQWSPNGSRLISADQVGVINVWKYESAGRGKLSPVVQYQRRDLPTHCLFLPQTSSNSSSPASPQVNAAGTAERFVFATASGAVFTADDTGTIVESFNVGSQLAALLHLAAPPQAVGGMSIGGAMVAANVPGSNSAASGDALVALTNSSTLAMFQLATDGSASQMLKAKVSSGSAGEGSSLKGVWVGRSLLATCSGSEASIRVWDLANDDNYAISAPESWASSLPSKPGITGADRIHSMSYNSVKRVLAGLTKDGRLYFWQYIASANRSKGAEDWQPITQYDAGLPGTELNWGPGERVLSVHIPPSVAAAAADDSSRPHLLIIHESSLQRRLKQGIAAVQVAMDSVLLTPCPVSKASISSSKLDTPSVSVKCGLRIRGLDVNAQHLIVFNGKQCEIYEHNQGNGPVKLLKSMPLSSNSVAVHGENLYACTTARPGSGASSSAAVAAASAASQSGRIDVITIANGQRKPALQFPDAEGIPIRCDVNGDHLVAVTSRNVVRVWDIGRREPKNTALSKKLFDANVEVLQARINITGTRVALLCRRSDAASGSDAKRSAAASPAAPSAESAIETSIFVYETEQDTLSSFDFANQSSFASRMPVTMAWDEIDAKLIAVEHKPLKAASDDDADPDAARLQVATLFTVSAIEGAAVAGSPSILQQDSMPVPSATSVLLACAAPTLAFATHHGTSAASASSSSSSSRPAAPITSLQVEFRPLRDFEGIRVSDDETRSALMHFSYFLTLGDMDHAYRAVKQIQDPSVWMAMALMCVKTRRLDVAEICLGNMQNAVATKALRQAKSSESQSLESKIAMLAVQLGLYDDAERLYKSSNRFDLLNNLYQSSGEWEKALEIADKHDRIHLRTTHFLYARSCEQSGDTQRAIRHYEQAKTHRYDVPRMLFDAGSLDTLERYVSQSKDVELQKWWGQYAESNGHLDTASQYYLAAQDALSLVRIHCFNGSIERAVEIALEANDPAACYHLARQLEEQGRVKEAIHLYSASTSYRHAIRLAKESGMDHEVMNLALQAEQAEPAVLVEAARYFEAQGAFDRAVQLYHKGGDLSRAIDLCFGGQLFDLLNTVAEGLGKDSDPAVLMRCAEFFAAHNQMDKAVNMLVTGGRYEEAIKICMDRNVRLTDELAEAMTLAKSAEGDERENERRNNLLRAIAKVAKRQGQFHLATKKYTQAGDKIKAMKALIKSGDTEKIVFFAGVSRQREIYILAANYLQNLDWHNDPEILKNIIAFYTKAKSLDSLAAFYESCSQVEIDEYRDYEKALGALKEAVKYIQKGRVHDKDTRLTSLRNRIYLVDRFVQARSIVAQDAQETVKICSQLLEQPDVETALRIGDVFALLIELRAAQGEMHEAYQLIEHMRDRNVILSYYLDRSLIERILNAVGASSAGGGRRGGEEQGRRAQHHSALSSSISSNAGVADDDEIIDEQFVEEDV